MLFACYPIKTAHVQMQEQTKRECVLIYLPSPPSGMHDKDVIALEPRPHHNLLASIKEDSAETEEDLTTLTCGVRGTLFVIICEM